jgi:hypothetical protein
VLKFGDVKVDQGLKEGRMEGVEDSPRKLAALKEGGASKLVQSTVE